MSVSASRTITLALPAANGLGVLASPRPQFWPAKRAGDSLDYSLDLSKWLADASDTIVSVTASASPSEQGDLAVQSISVFGSIIELWLSGGQPGVLYSVELDIATPAGRLVVAVILLMVNPGGAPVATTPAPITWTAALPMMLSFARPLSVSTIAAL